METIRFGGDSVEIIDQTLLPGTLKIRKINTLEEMLEAIRNLRVRGAPALGVAAAFGLYLGIRGYGGNDRDGFLKECRSCAALLKASRPTAVNIAWALERVLRKAEEALAGRNVAETKAGILAEAERIREEDREICRRIGEEGSALIPPQASIITHCNAGALATAGEGTALSVIYQAARQGKVNRVYVDETRPLGQGARLTAWELCQHNIPATVLCDNMAASLLRDGGVHCAIAGADRIAANGDTANKIGTLGLAIICRFYQVPLYIAAPSHTVDYGCPAGEAIPIEMRPESEIRVWGNRKQVPDECSVYNPAFDVTPAGLITAFITEQGVLRAPFKRVYAG